VSERPFRIGIIGAGMITLDAHLPACLASEQVTVTALVDPVVERARQAAVSYGVTAKLASRIEEVLGEIDGAIIATPNDSHCELALKCFAAGVDVLIEKPLAASAADGERIVSAARQAGRIAAVGYCTRFRNCVRLLGALLERGHFGRVTRFVHQFGTPGGWAPFSAYNLSRGSAGGGVLMVTASHFIDRLLSLWGMPDRVAFADDSLGGPEANCVAEFFWDAGRHAGLHGMGRYSKTVRLPAGLAIDTEAGIVKLADTSDAQITLVPRGQPDLETVVRHRHGAEEFNAEKSEFQLQVEDFVAACRWSGKPMVDTEQALESQRLIERLYAERTALPHSWYPPAAVRKQAK
jgi:predicted dehydrogenase